MAGGVIPRTAASMIGRGVNAPATGLIQTVERGRPGQGRGRRAPAPTSGGAALHQSETLHTSQAQWTSDPLTVASGRSRLITILVTATGPTPGVVGSLTSSGSLLATAPVDGSGEWAQTITWLAGSGGSLTVSVGWPSAETGTLVATLIDPGAN